MISPNRGPPLTCPKKKAGFKVYEDSKFRIHAKKKINLPPENRWMSSLKRDHFKRKCLYSNHQFSGDMLVFRGYVWFLIEYRSRSFSRFERQLVAGTPPKNNFLTNPHRVIRHSQKLGIHCPLLCLDFPGCSSRNCLHLWFCLPRPSPSPSREWLHDWTAEGWIMTNPLDQLASCWMNLNEVFVRYHLPLMATQRNRRFWSFSFDTLKKYGLFVFTCSRLTLCAATVLEVTYFSIAWCLLVPRKPFKHTRTLMTHTHIE